MFSRGNNKTVNNIRLQSTRKTGLRAFQNTIHLETRRIEQWPIKMEKNDFHSFAPTRYCRFTFVRFGR